MCAIAGVLNRGDAAALVRGMMLAQRHRGPDGEGLFADTEARMALGHRRLAILDLSEAGAQPMTSHDGRFTLVLNGEVFNYREMARELGIAPRTGTDTEVLLEACAKLGAEGAAQRAAGMFAFALWDRLERRLTLVRDRLGEKPLVYFDDGKMFAFASELKALAPIAGARLDASAVDAYLTLGYVPAPLSILRNCRKLEPGHLLEWCDGRSETRRWWFPERAERRAARPRSARIAELRERVADAVRLRLRADVPLALCLSGGVDSSIVARECARAGANLEAFTVAFDGDAIDLEFASRAAGHFGLKHEIIRAAASLAAPLKFYDEPFADSSSIPSLALARALEGRFKAVLNGDGGDEAFGGYRHYEFIAAKQAAKNLASIFGLQEGRGPLNVYVQSKAAFRSAERVRLLNGHAPADSISERLGSDEFLRAAPAGALGRAMWTDRHLHLPNDLTYKMDIALGACGIEGRAPFLDHRVLEWAQTLPAADLVRGARKKVLLREAYRGEIPDTILDRPKHGFGAPIDRWLAGPLREEARTALKSPLLDLSREKNLSGQRLWTVVAFARWAERWRATW